MMSHCEFVIFFESFQLHIKDLEAAQALPVVSELLHVKIDDIFCWFHMLPSLRRLINFIATRRQLAHVEFVFYRFVRINIKQLKGKRRQILSLDFFNFAEDLLWSELERCFEKF